MLAGGTVSRTRTADGSACCVEARPAPRTGGVVLVQRARRRRGAGDAASCGLLDRPCSSRSAVAIGFGLLVAWRLARPLRRTAHAAHRSPPDTATSRCRPRGRPRSPTSPTPSTPSPVALRALRGAAAGLPAVGLTRPAHAADRDHRLCGVAGRRRHRRPTRRRRSAASCSASRNVSSASSPTCSISPGSALRTSASTSPTSIRRAARAIGRGRVGGPLRRDRRRFGLEAAAVAARRAYRRDPAAPGPWTGCSTTRCG